MLELNIPVLNDTTDHNELVTLLNPDLLQSWLRDLPARDVVTTGVMLLDVITYFNHVKLEVEHRNILLEVLHPVIKDTLKKLKNKSRYPSMPLPRDKLEKYQLVQDLLHEFAKGFRLIVSDKVNTDQASNKKDSRLISSVYFALCYASLSLLEYYSLYTEVPAGIWKGIHQLYSYAEKNGFSENKIIEDRTQSISRIYKRIVLLALANPYHLMQGEAEKVHASLGTWEKYCKITPLGSLSPTGKCIVELTEDRMPERFRMDQGWTKLKSVDARVVDISEVLVKLKTLIEKISPKETKENKVTVSTLILRNNRDFDVRLFDAWSVRKERKSERKQSKRNIVMAAGLSATHYFMNGEIPFTPETISRMGNAGDKIPKMGDEKSVFSLVPEPAHFDQKNNIQPDAGGDSNLSGLSLIPFDDVSYANDAGINNMAITGRQSLINDTRKDSDLFDPWSKVCANVSNEVDTENKHPATNIWMQKNRSIGGLALYCNLNPDDGAMQQNESEDGAALSFDSTVNLKVHVGDIVAYKDALIMGAGWKVGSIRWIKTDCVGQMDLGIKKLSDAGKAVATRAIQGVGKGGEYFRAILMSGDGDTSENQTLITSSAVYDLGTVLQIKSGEGVKKVKLTRVLETTGSFTHYEYMPVSCRI